MANKQTAVEYLIEEISSKAVGVTPKCLLNAFEKAKAMEKQASGQSAQTIGPGKV